VAEKVEGMLRWHCCQLSHWWWGCNRRACYTAAQLHSGRQNL